MVAPPTRTVVTSTIPSAVVLMTSAFGVSSVSDSAKAIAPRSPLNHTSKLLEAPEVLRRLGSAGKRRGARAFVRR